ncbi:uncharacterized protein K452DRAFT_108670 [Aplosporella prunicola CBS 121167]|uniref:GPI2-domain-containing protein n=1 Tax=Aplosporella prunicola CBS 121167 TaxID=1176127 RepID=A0A6A6BSS4_9PEZI|nr:uncharacterized protein K452DRAFT_108670 [Aplosporella prunicola CBS 121167]KAF2146294.1 hypothetical protein K452DRAFT_108670 [Aplosporella prunicola CBS 121167]
MPAYDAPPPTASTTATQPYALNSLPPTLSSTLHSPPSDPSRLAPEDAFYAHSPPRRQRAHSPLGMNGAVDGVDALPVQGRLLAGIETRRKRERERGRSGSRRRKGAWKKLLWVKQAYPDNYTDEETFLDHLQRNPRLQPYEFWPLVTDSTVIVQHVCSVTIFLCCFTGIIQERVSPVTIVSWGSLGTVLGWVLWDFWVGQEEAAEVAAAAAEAKNETLEADGSSSTSSTTSSAPTPAPGHTKDSLGLGLVLPQTGSAPNRGHMKSASIASMGSNASAVSAVSTGHPTGAPTFATYRPPYGEPVSSLSPRNQQRLATVKSAILIYCALLGLSPILKSLTKSTTSDSIWAMSCWLMCINVFFFDYGGGVGAKFPASLSTNAALMASTVLASRLESTTHVFSLTLFSIEVFGLFPVFRRHLRHISWHGHLMLTILLVWGAGGGVVVTVSGGGWKAALAGIILGSILTGLAVGTGAWWLIGLQKYKNEIHGPWDPARPIIRRRWD